MSVLCMPECGREEEQEINAKFVIEISCKVRAIDLEQAKDIIKLELDEIVKVSKLKSTLPKDDGYCSEWGYNEEIEEW